MNQAVQTFFSALNAALFSLSPTDSRWIVLAVLLVLIGGLAALVLFPVLRHRLGFRVASKGVDLGPLYGYAIWMHLVLGTLCCAFAGYMWLDGSGAAGCTGATSTPSPTGPASSRLALRVLNNDLFLWRDLCAAPLSSGSQMVPPGSASSIPVGSLESISLVMGALPLLLMGLAFLLARFLKLPAEAPFGRKLLFTWGHIQVREKKGATERTEHGAARWLWRTGVAISLLFGLCWLASMPALPLFGAKGAPPVLPIWVWSLGTGTSILFAGLLLTGGMVETTEEAPTVAPPEKPELRTRLQWEQFIAAEGYVLRQQASGRSDATTKALNHAPARTTIGEKFQYFLEHRLGEPDNNAPLHREMWDHQAAFTRILVGRTGRVDTNDQPKFAPGQSILMHTAMASGRTAVVLECAAQTAMAKGRTALLLYPNAPEAREAYDRLERGLGVASGTRQPLVRIQYAEGRVDAAEAQRIIVAPVSWLVEELLPSFQFDKPLYAPFVGELGLVVLEDIEQLSGIRATNMVLVMRRLYRLFNHYNANPCLAMTVCNNPASGSGVLEFAQRLSGPLDLYSGSERTDMPNRPVYGYVLVSAPARRDAGGVDVLPAMASLALTSSAWTAPTRLDANSVVQRHDHIPPKWTITLAEEQQSRADLTREAPLRKAVHDAWVRITEVDVHEALSVPELVRAGGIKVNAEAFEAVHLAVLAPHFVHRGLLDFLLLSFASSTEGDEESVWSQIRKLGCRLVNGEPTHEVLRRHVLAALAELPGPQEDLSKLLPDAAPLHVELEKLSSEDRLDRKTIRKLGLGDALLVQQHLVSKRDERPITPLETLTEDYGILRLVGNSRILQRMDLRHARRSSYPGMAFQVDGRRYRVIEARYGEFLQRLATAEARINDRHRRSEECWLACDLDDSISFTVPIFDRSIKVPEGAPIPSTPANLQETHNDSGATVFRWRTHFAVKEAFCGRWDFQVDHEGSTQRSHHRWRGQDINWELPMEALVLATTHAEILQDSEAATLRRLLENGLHALTRLESHAVGVHVVPELGPAAPEKVGPLTSAILILAPFNGEAGLLSALGASPWRFVNGLLTMVWHWADYLSKRNDPSTWADIGFLGSLDGDELLNPTPAHARDFVGRLLGDQAPEPAPSELPVLPPLHAFPGPVPTGGIRLDHLLKPWPTSTQSTYLAMGDLIQCSEECESILDGILDGRPREASLFNVLLVDDWMQRNIRYIHDHRQYGKPDHWAAPSETLKSRAGDCEDHAILFCSLLHGLGVESRIVVIPRHALAEVYIGPVDLVDKEAIATEIAMFLVAVSRNLGLEACAVPYQRGRLLGGWEVRDGQPVRVEGQVEEHVPLARETVDASLRWNEDHGHLWLAVDNPFNTRFPGDLRAHERNHNWGAEGWASLIAYAYATMRAAESPAPPPSPNA